MNEFYKLVMSDLFIFLLCLAALIISIIAFVKQKDKKTSQSPTSQSPTSQSPTSQSPTSPPQHCDVKKRPLMVGFFQMPGFDLAGIPDDAFKFDNYDVILDAFWINYPFCWTKCGIGGCDCSAHNPSNCYSAIKPCTSMEGYPSDPKYAPPGQPGLATGCGFPEFLKGSDWQGGDPTIWQTTNSQYNNYFVENLHGPYPAYSAKLREQNPHKVILCSIGGWNMGGSALDDQGNPKSLITSSWKKCSSDSNGKDLDKLRDTIKQIMKLTTSGGKQLYDGVDVDCETLFMFDDKATNQDDQIHAFVKLFSDLKTWMPNIKISMSPRQEDFWNFAKSKAGWASQVVTQLANKKVYFDYLNPQCYNSGEAGLNINGKGDTSNKIFKTFIPYMLNLSGIKGKNNLNIGVLAQDTQGNIDCGAPIKDGESYPTSCQYSSGDNQNSGVSANDLCDLWKNLQNTSTTKDVNGIMTWSINICAPEIKGNSRCLQEPKPWPGQWRVSKDWSQSVR